MNFPEDGSLVPNGERPLPVVHSNAFTNLKYASHKCLMSFSIPVWSFPWAPLPGLLSLPKLFLQDARLIEWIHEGTLLLKTL